MLRTYNDLNDIRRSFDELFESFFTTTPRRPSGHETAQWTFTPAVETGWTDEHLNLRFIVPGVTEKDLKLTVQGNQLFVRGERPVPQNFGKEGYVWSHVPYGKFERALDLPAGLDLDKLEANLHDGFLDVRIPLASVMKPKQISISVKPRKELAA